MKKQKYFREESPQESAYLSTENYNILSDIKRLRNVQVDKDIRVNAILNERDILKRQNADLNLTVNEQKDRVAELEKLNNGLFKNSYGLLKAKFVLE